MALSKIKSSSMADTAIHGRRNLKAAWDTDLLGDSPYA